MTKLQFSLALLSVFLMGLAANAQQACSASNIAGRYAVKCSGYLTPGPNAPMLPAAALSTAKGETNGDWSGTGTLSLGGTIVTQNVTSVGPVEVNPDCTGSLTYAQTINGQPAPDIHFNFIVKKNGLEIDGIGTDPGSVFSCTLTRVRR